MASLVKLPAEIIQLICFDLTAHDVLGLCRSCKDLHSKAHPSLFRHITISWEPLWDLDEEEDKPPNVMALLLFILRHPSYTRYIKMVDIRKLDYHWFHHAFSPPYTIVPPLSLPRHGYGNASALVRDVLVELCLPGPGEWFEAVVEKGDPGAILALFLAQCTHLESLAVHLHFVSHSEGLEELPYNKWFTLMMKHALSAPEKATRLSRFHRLSNFALSDLDTRKGWPDHVLLPKEIALLPFYLPSITTISIDTCPKFPGRQRWERGYSFREEPFWPLPVAPRAASLATLCFGSTAAPAGSIRFLLRHTPNLGSLAYNCRGPDSVDMSELRAGLDYVSSTLAHLEVGHTVQLQLPLPHMVVRGSLGSLAGFAALEDLRVSLGLLFGQVAPPGATPLADVLPPRLKRLAINDDLSTHCAFHEWLGEPTMALLSDFFDGSWKAATPCLGEFVLDMRRSAWMPHEYWIEGGKQDELRRLVESQGVQCTMLSRDLRLERSRVRTSRPSPETSSPGSPSSGSQTS